MRVRKLFTLGATLAILAVAAFVTSAWAVTEKVLHDFKGTDGANPRGLVFDASGNLYGTSYYGGDASCYDGNGQGCGTVFELTPNTGGGWTENVLHRFSKKDRGGYNPSDGLILDASGNVYGTAGQGGAYDGGTVFELMPKADGAWRVKVLYSFKRRTEDGYGPSAGLVFDASGNLYGTTYHGGGPITACSIGFDWGCGTVFELIPKAGGGWLEKILHRFKSDGSEGNWPSASLIFDSSGNLYSVTYETAFELTPNAGGGWALRVLHRFSGRHHDGFAPSGSLIFDSLGNLYGTTYYGPLQGYGGPCRDGTNLGCGVAFELTPRVAGDWGENILHHFKSDGNDGFHPSNNLIGDASGHLYGTTSEGGHLNGGTVFELIPKAGGGWTEKILHAFNYNGKNGFSPDALIFDAAGNFYGTTFYGGTGNCLNGRQGGCGTVFEIIP